MVILAGGLFLRDSFSCELERIGFVTVRSLMLFFECLECPIRDTWIKSYTDRADSSNRLTYSELFSLLEGRGSRLLEDHYRTLLTSSPNIPKLILHEVHNKRQRFENLVSEAESAGEHLSDGELKAIIFAKMPADTAASLKQEQSNEKVESWWTKVTGFPTSMRSPAPPSPTALQPCRPPRRRLRGHQLKAHATPTLYFRHWQGVSYDWLGVSVCHFLSAHSHIHTTSNHPFHSFTWSSIRTVGHSPLLHSRIHSAVFPRSSMCVFGIT